MIESVAVRQRGAYDFQTHYDSLCALQNSCPLPAVKGHLAEGVLDMNGDRIRVKDWLPILSTLQINKTLEFIAVRSYYQQTLEEQEKRGNTVRRKPPAIRSKEITYRLCRGIQDCLIVTPTLYCVELQGLPLRTRDLTILAKGLAKNTTCRHLSLEYSSIGDEGLEILCKGVKNSPSITSVNFTGCNLTSKSAETLAKIIRHQAMKRHSEAWQDSLRYRRPDLDRMAGIRRITANSNPLLGDRGAAYFAEALKDDLWLKALDLQQSGLSDVGAKSLLDVLKYNTTIVVLDVRQNPMIDQEVIRSIMEHVMINCSGQDTEFKWIKAEPLHEPSKARSKKRRTKTLQSSFGKKTTIKVTNRAGNRQRSKSAGAVTRSMQPINAEQVKSAPGMPWRTALRADRDRGYPPEHTPGQASLFERLDEESPERETSTRIDYTASSIDETADISQTDVAQNLAIGKQLKVELEQLRRRLQEETTARSKAEERVIELTIEYSRLRQEVDENRARRSLLDDDRILESIEGSFQQFHNLLDMLRDAGLGQLITIAGLDESRMTVHSHSFTTAPKKASREQPTREIPAGGYPERKEKVIDIEPPTDLSKSESLHIAQPLTNGHAQQPASFHQRQGMPNSNQSGQDPTMQPADLHDFEYPEQHTHSKFDDLYQRVLKETEGALSQTREGSVTSGSGMNAAESSNQTRSAPAGQDEQARVSDNSIHSQGSHKSTKSQHSTHSTGKKSNAGSVRSAEESQRYTGTAPDSMYLMKNGGEHITEQHYSEIFEKSPDISEDIEFSDDDIM